MVICVSLTCIAGVLILFPRQLPSTLRRQAKRVVRQANRDKEEYGGEGRGIHYFASLARTKMITAEPPNLKSKTINYTDTRWLGCIMLLIFPNRNLHLICTKVYHFWQGNCLCVSVCFSHCTEVLSLQILGWH